jgi:2-succinyl-5-enolpyruvyl-6-hydroxy-3-cyclohexene-1-carboxylate synthase
MVALNVGPDFKQRWLEAPEAVRQTFMDDLNHICDLLQPKTQTQLWLAADQKAQQQAQQTIEQAYADLKARLIEEAQVRRQLALEQSLANKRAATEHYAQQLFADEKRQYAEQTHTLDTLRQHIEQETLRYTERYHVNDSHQNLDFAPGMVHVSDQQILSELETVRLRLELEAEAHIEQAVSKFRNKLRAAAQEEIEYILHNSNFSDVKPTV